jgi:hypothetical protein
VLSRESIIFSYEKPVKLLLIGMTVFSDLAKQNRYENDLGKPGEYE